MKFTYLKPVTLSLYFAPTHFQFISIDIESYFNNYMQRLCKMIKRISRNNKITYSKKIHTDWKSKTTLRNNFN